MKATVHTDPDSLEELSGVWNALVAQDPSASVFQTPEFAAAWWRGFGDGSSLALVEVREDEAPVGIAPMRMDENGTLTFIGDPDVADYMAPICRPEHREGVGAAIIDVAGSLGADRLDLGGLPDASSWPRVLLRAAGEAGYSARGIPEAVCPRVALPDSYEGYLGWVSAKTRHEIRRKARRLAAVGDVRVRLSHAGGLLADLSTFFSLHRSSPAPKGSFLSAEMAGFFSRLAESLAGAGRLRLAVLELDGVAVAAHFGFAMNGVWSLYNSAFDQSRAGLAPGMVLVAECIRLACEQGCRTFDFLRGPEDYKYRFGAADAPVVRLEIRARGE